MKQKLLLKSMLLLFALIAGSSSVWADDYELYSGAITEGDYVIYYNGKAMKNTIASNRLEYTAVTPSENKITDPDASIVWHIAASGDYWTIYNAGDSKYAGSTSAKIRQHFWVKYQTMRNGQSQNRLQEHMSLKT